MVSNNVKIAGLTLFIVSLVFSVGADTLVSTPNEVTTSENATFIFEDTQVDQYNLELVINGSNGFYKTNLSAESGVAETTKNVSEIGLGEGEYTVTFNAENNSENYDETKTSTFEVTGQASGIAMIDLTSKSIDQSECPLNKSNSISGKCKTFGINMSVDISSNLKELSESGKPLKTSLSKGKYIALVDTEREGNYNRIYWDDDSTFREDNETRKSEKAFLRTGETVKQFKVDNTQVNLRPIIVGDNVALVATPSLEERPLRQGDSKSYTFLAYSQSKSNFGLSLNIEPIDGRKISATAINLENSNKKEITPSVSQTNKYGLTGVGKINSVSIGRHKVNIGNISSSYYSVSKFDVEYDVLDPSTNERKSTFKPGDEVKVRAKPVSGGSTIDYQEIKIEYFGPSETRKTKTLTSKNEATFRIPQNSTAGTGYFNINVTSTNGISQQANANFNIKKFKVHTFPLKDSQYGPQRVENIAPGNTGYAFVGAVKLGTFGGVQQILNADFYDIDNPATNKDECKENTKNVDEGINSQLSLKIVNKTSLNNSEIFTSSQLDIPEKMRTQCIIKFKTGENNTGFYSGEVVSSRKNSNESQSGRLSFSITKYEMKGKTVNPSTGNLEYEFGPNSDVGIEPQVTNIANYSEVENSRIIDASVISIDGENNATANNVSFNKSGNNLIKFETPNQAGWYKVRFSAEINNTDNTSERVTAEDYFSVAVMDVESEVVKPKGFTVTPSQNVVAEIDVSDLSGNAKSGVEVSLETLENSRTDTNFLSKVQAQTNTTNTSGKAKINITPNKEWETGWYRAEISAKDPQGNRDTGYLYFDVEKYQKYVRKSLNGQPCQFRCQPSKGDIIGFKPQVTEIKSKVKRDYRIKLDKSSITYFGSRGQYIREELELENYSEKQNNSLKLNSSSLEPGSYTVNIKLDLENSDDTVNAESFLRLQAYEFNLTQISQGRSYQPGANITYQFNSTKKSNYTITSDTFRNYDYETGEEYEVEPNLSVSFQGKSQKFNVTLPPTAEEGHYYGDLEIKTNGSTQYKDTSFEVETLGVSMPVKSDIRYDKLEKDTEDIYEDQVMSNCTQISNQTTYTFENGEIKGKCYLSKDQVVNSNQSTIYHALWVTKQNSNYNRSFAYISQNKFFNESGDVATNESIGDITNQIGSGLKFNVTDMDQYGLALRPTNGYITSEGDIIVKGQATKYLATFSENYEIEKDINGDSDLKDRIYALISKNSTLKPRFSLDRNLTEDSSTQKPQRTSLNLGGATFYSGTITKTTRDFSKYSQRILLSEKAEYPFYDSEISSNMNFLFPTVVEYPNGTAVPNTTVKIDKIIRKSDSKVFKSPETSKTDQNGMTFLNVSLPDNKEISTGYKVVPYITVKGENKSIDGFNAPEVTQSKFGKQANYYEKTQINDMRNYTNPNATANELEIENNENLEILNGVSESQNYRFTRVNETKSDCSDINRNYECGDKLSILLYQGFYNVSGMNVSELIIDDDNRITEDYDNETRENEEQAVHYFLSDNLSDETFETSNGVFIQDTFAVFDEQKDNLDVYNERYRSPANKEIYLLLRFTDLFDESKGRESKVKIDQVSYNGETYENTTNLTGQTDANGIEIMNISREDFEGNISNWPEEEFLEFTGTFNGTRFSITQSIGKKRVNGGLK